MKKFNSKKAVNLFVTLDNKQMAVDDFLKTKKEQAEAAKKVDAMEDKTEAKMKHRHHKVKEKI